MPDERLAIQSADPDSPPVENVSPDAPTQGRPVPKRAAAAAEPQALNARQLYRFLITIYIQGSLTAVVIVFFLVYLGLEFSGRQWATLFGALPLAMAFYVSLDIMIINRHYQPLGRVLDLIDGPDPAPKADISMGIVRALNLPYLTFMRVMFVHGPCVTVAVLTTLVIGNLFLHAEFHFWQMMIFTAIVFCFASPAHAIFEYFTVKRCMVPLIERLYPLVESLEDEYQMQLKPTGIRKTLLYLAIFITSFPLLFLATSVAFKVSMLIHQAGADGPSGQMTSLLLWIYGIVAICLVGAYVMATLTASELSRSAGKLATAMQQVERGDLDVRLQIISTDEYAVLFRGFNLMTEELNEEVKILGISHHLMGELKIDNLLARIIHVSTELLDAERSTLFLYDERRDELWSRFAEGVERQEIRIKTTAGIAGSVFTSGRLENIFDVSKDPRFNPEVDRRTGFHTRNMLTVPVVNKAGERIGVTQVLNKRHGHFTHKDEARMRAFTAQIAIALENAKLFDDVLRVQNYNEAILRSTSNAMITLGRDRHIVTANAASLRLLKGGHDEFVGKSLESVFGTENQWVLDSVGNVEMSRDTDLSVEAALLLGTGETASVNLTTVPLIDAAREVIGTMLIFEDITDEKRVKSTMSRYMSKEVVDQLLDSGDTALGGQVQRVTLLFSDIRNFTSISENIGARDTVSLLNEYFTEMVDVVFKHSGILDKYIGDAIMALFGAPFSGELDANNAMRAANDMIVTLRALNAKFIAAGKRPIGIGVGLNTGDAVVGSIGSPKRMEYTAIGDTVNLASRLESACKTYGVKVIVSEFTVRHLIDKWQMREIDRLRVKGKEQPVAIYEALDHHTPETFPNMAFTLENFTLGVEAYRRQDWAGALTRLERALTLCPNDVPSRIYRDRCVEFAANPPGDAWDGVFVMKGK